MKNIFILMAIAFGFLGCASKRKLASVFSGNRLEVSPEITAAGVKQVNGPHIVYWNPQRSNGKLLITFGGTGAKAADLSDFAQVAVDQGYHVISLDYFNSVITTTCRDNDKTECFDQFREEIGLGRQVSDLLEVDAHNSIRYRLMHLLEYLSTKDPEQWKAFYQKDEVVWKDVVLAGNSQGAGHAAFFSKMYSVAKVIMICGPQDHFKDRPAPWILKKGKTAGNRYFALLHRDDYFDSKLQIDTYKHLCNCEDMSHVIVSTKEVPDTHNSLLTPLYSEEWAQLLKIP